MPKQFDTPADQLQRASLTRRLVAMLYDALICIALLMMTTGIYMALASAMMGAEEFRAYNESGQSTGDPMLRSMLFISLYLFFGFFWTRLGQTLGMQAWHLRVQNADGTSISWLQALLRYMMAWLSAAAFGLGYLWCLWDKEGKTWHDRFSDTEVVRIPKPTKK